MAGVLGFAERFNVFEDFEYPIGNRVDILCVAQEEVMEEPNSLPNSF
jgi:hypothetical protein